MVVGFGGRVADAVMIQQAQQKQEVCIRFPCVAFNRNTGGAAGGVELGERAGMQFI